MSVERAESEAFAMMDAAEAKIIETKDLKPEDIRIYLETKLAARALLVPFFSKHQASHDRLQNDLSSWDTDRTGCLLDMLSTLAQTSHLKNLASIRNQIQAETRCILAMIDMPLIPDLNQTNYKWALAGSQHALNTSKPLTHQDIKLIATYAAAVAYNAEKYAPDLFNGGPKIDIKRDRQQLVKWISRLHTELPLE